MFSFRFLFLLFILVPFVEIYLLIEIGSEIGAVSTIALVVLTAVIGAWLVRRQGVEALTRVQHNLDQGVLPAMELLEGLFLLVAGALLLTPGFFTDAIGFACLTPPLRRMMITWLARRRAAQVAAGRSGPGRAGSGASARPGQPLEGEFTRVDDDPRR